MRQTTDFARTMNDLATYTFQFLASESTKRSLTDDLGVDYSNCPFVNATCNLSSLYHSLDGTCNNLINSLYGSVNVPFKRWYTPVYDDGSNSPRTTATSGNELPNVRTVSLGISPMNFGLDSEELVSHLFVIFGQFLTHDIVGISAITGILF